MIVATYSAIVQDEKYPCGYIKFLSARRIDAINRAILATGKAWPGLELPRAIKRGYSYSAYFDGYRISVFKES